MDQVTIHLSRLIEIGAVYGTLKDEDSKSIFRDLSNDAEQKSPPSRKVASKGRVPRGDSEAEQQYNDVRKDIFDSSPVNTSRKEVEKSQISSDNRELNNAEMRAAMCGKLVGSPAVPHTPPNSVRVTTLQNLLPRWLARFLARMPFLLRLLLLPLSYLHPIVISSITVAGPGYWLAEMLQDRILDYYIQDTDEGKELSERIKTYVQEAMFTFDTYDLSALGQVPVRTMHDIRAELRGATGTVFRAAPDTVGSLMEFAGSDLEYEFKGRRVLGSDTRLVRHVVETKNPITSPSMSETLADRSTYHLGSPYLRI